MDFCFYLYQIRNLGNELLKYKFPAIADFVKIVKAFSFKNNFKCTNFVKLKYLSQKHCIQCHFINKYDSYNDIQSSCNEIFHVYE